MSITIPVYIDGFVAGSPWEHLNGITHNYTFTPAEVLRAAIVAGYWDEYGIPSMEFRRWRAAAIRMAVRSTGGALVRPPEWDQLDSSEKATITSLLGVVTTKLLAEKILNAPYLLFLDVHFDLIRKKDAPKLRPDFIGLAPHGAGWRYFSIEAKGRERFSQTTLDKGKEQAKSLGKVDGTKVAAHVVCYTTMPHGKLAARFHDPIPDDGELHEALAVKAEGLSGYYRSLSALLDVRDGTEQRKATIWRDNIYVTPIPELNAAIGIHPLALESMNSPDRLLAVLPQLAKLSQKSEGVIGLDGIVVIPSRSWLAE